MNKSLKGSIYLTLSTIIYGLYGLFSRQTSVFNPFAQTTFKYIFIVLIILVIFIFQKDNWKRINKKDIKWFLVWIVPCSFQPILSFIAFNHLPLGTVYFLIYSTMISGGIISGLLFFKEQLTTRKLLSFILIILGLYFIYSHDLTLLTSIYAFFALISGLTIGFWNTLTKKLSTNYPELEMVAIDSTSAVIIGIIGMIAFSEPFPSTVGVVSWFWLLIFSSANILASYLLIKGFKYVEAQRGSLILPLELIFASFFGYIFFEEVLPFTTYLGGVLILSAAITATLET